MACGPCEASLRQHGSDGPENGGREIDEHVERLDIMPAAACRAGVASHKEFQGGGSSDEGWDAGANAADSAPSHEVVQEPPLAASPPRGRVGTATSRGLRSGDSRGDVTCGDGLTTYV